MYSEPLASEYTPAPLVSSISESWRRNIKLATAFGLHCNTLAIRCFQLDTTLLWSHPVSLSFFTVLNILNNFHFSPLIFLWNWETSHDIT